MTGPKPWILAALGCCALLAAGCAELSTKSIEDALYGSRPLDEGTVAAGLKEALRVGTERSVTSTSTLDGFLGNALIRIAIPEEFDEAADLLRTVGFAAQVDEFEVAMNRSAERAAGEAKGVFWSAVTGMSIADAFAILNGPDDAATQYFRGRTEAELRSRFTPIVEDKMEEVGLYRLYEEIAGYYDQIPFKDKPALDLTAHITDGTLDGLFTVLAQEEQQIRENPAARTTDLLRRVFGREGSR